MFNKLSLNSSLKWISIFVISFVVLNERVVESVVQQTYSQAFNPLTPGSQSADHCYRQSRCRPLHNSQCLDVSLPYKFTTSTVWEDQAFGEIHDYLNRWKGLRSIPQCWKALQSVLCATFFPRCDNESSRVSLPTHDMCRLTRHPCRLIEQHHHWPEFLRCDNTTLFPNKCKNDYTDLKFNTSGIGAKCSAPLVQTDDQNIWYPGIEGCALQCPNPIYTGEEHRKVKSFISHGAAISLLTTFFSVLTFIIDWRSSNRYPAAIIFYLNMCLMISNIGWLLGSALTKGHNEIVCRPDNTTRYAEPGNSPENFYCLTTFLLIYYFSMAALVWFVNLGYSWDLAFQITGVAHRDIVDSKVAYFHLTAWSVPLMLTISILALGEVDGDSLRGICFVGVLKPVMRICFVLVPTTVSLIIGCYYLLRAMYRLIKVKLMVRKQNKTNRKSKKIEHMVIRIGLFVLCAIISVIMTYISHIYELTNSSHWKNSLNDYIICTLNMTAALYPESADMSSADSSIHSCKLAERPNLMYAYLQLLSVFGTGIFASSWVWTSNTFRSWKRFIARHLKPDSNEPVSLKRHEMISKVFRRRQQLSQGCYSPSFHSMHSDPVGMNLNSAVSQDLSATWAAALPNFIYRRGAIAANDPNSQTNHYLPTFVGTRHSSNSDVSQQRSYDSYRRSLDSQYSLEQLEMAVIDRHHRRKTKKEREKLLKAHNRTKPYRLSRRRGSDTSSSIISAALAVRGFNKGAKSECKYTSTGDLMQLAAHPVPNMMAPNPPFINTPIASPSAIPMPFVSPPVPRPRVARPAATSYSFTHCMTDQSSHLTNPLLERRRPDSCLPNAQMENRGLGTGHVIQPPNTTPNGTLIGNNTNSNPNIQLAMNFGMPFPMNNLNTTNLSAGMGFMPSAQPLNYYQHSMNTFYGNLMATNQMNAFGPNFLGPYPPTTPLPNMSFPSQYPPYPQYPQMTQPQVPQQPQQCTNLQDIQALMREREAYLQLIRPMDSASEVEDNYLPIQLSDSEGLYSPDLQSRNEGLITAQELVDAHIQQVEARLEAKGINGAQNQTVVGALGDGSVAQVLEVQSPKSKSESKRKKKKSSKKQNKSNGSVVNNNNNNTNNCDELEEQKPLMTTEEKKS